MVYRVVEGGVVGAHFGYLAYVILGGFLVWRWPRAIWPHLIAVGWAAVIVAFPLTCPLTWAQDWARRRAGEAPLTKGFIDRYIEGVLYPARFTWLVQVFVAIVIVASWAGAWWWRRNRRDTGPKSTESSHRAATV
jgi:Protein of Unknown function (DUF2784)